MNNNKHNDNDFIIDEPFEENFVDEEVIAPSSSRLSSARKSKSKRSERRQHQQTLTNTSINEESPSSIRKQRKSRSSVTPNNNNTMNRQQNNNNDMTITREDQEEALARVLAGQLRREYLSKEVENESLQRRMRDFQFAQQKRLEKYGHTRPWGILGLYEHLSAIRNDLEWAEDAAWRRDNHEPYLRSVLLTSPLLFCARYSINPHP